ncbi:MAG: hypothetical protein LUD27_06790 [Clostridia bacterium]|nr:hypothetical protein [Clostridia bacterium]
MTTAKKPKKFITVITYLIALDCLLLGLLLPLYKDANGENIMLALTLPSILGTTFGIDSLTDIGNKFPNGNTVSFFGLADIDINAIAILLYAVITVIGIIMLIPVISSKKRKTATVCASIVEVIALIALFTYIFNLTSVYAETYTTPSDFAANFPFDWCVIGLAFGGTLLMLIIQSLNWYKGGGVAKIIVWLLGLVCVFLLVTVTSVADIFGKLDGLLLTINSEPVSGYTVLNWFVSDTFADKGAYFFNSAAYSAASSTLMATVASIALSAGLLLVLVNHIIDVICLSAKTTKGGLIFDIIRYTVEIVCLIVGVVAMFFISDYSARPGIILYVIAAIALVDILISIGRLAHYKKAKLKVKGVVEPVKYFDGNIERPEEAYFSQPEQQPAAPAQVFISFYPGDPYHMSQSAQPVAVPAPYAPVSYAAPAPYATPAPFAPPAPAPAPANQAATQPDYRGMVYGGPSDEFIASLPENEKIEFAKIFISKEQGSFDCLPDYVIGGDNREFFSAIFINLNRFRPILSDGLMQNIYNQLS